MTIPTRLFCVYSQPIASFQTWKARGINCLFRYEPQNDANGNPTVTMAQWDAAANAAGLLRVRQPSSNLAADAADSNLIAFLQSPDEPDDVWVNGNTGITATLTAQYNAMKAAAPHMPVAINFDLWQTLWAKPPYSTMAAAADWLSGDEYPCNRGEATFAEFQGRIAYLKGLAGNKRTMFCIECSNQQLSKQYFPNGTGPTDAQVIAEVGLLGTSDVIFFPQQTAGQGNGFQYDATTPDTQAAIMTITGANDPLNGSVLTATNGKSYTLTAK